jgi:hypothetical protein
MSTVCRTVFLPPAPPRIEERYDAHQFRKGSRTVNDGKNGLDHTDRKVMSTKGRTYTSRQVIPPWTKNDAKVKLVVCRMLYAMAHMSAIGFPQDAFDKNPLGLALELEVALAKRCINFAVQRSPAVREGILSQKKSKKFGYARLLTRVIYERYRLGKNSCVISGELHGLVTPAGVRQLISRANEVARVYLPEDSLPLSKMAGQAAHDRLAYRLAKALGGQTKKGRRPNNVLPTALEVFKLVEAGRTLSDIASEYGAYPETISHKLIAGRKEFFGVPKQVPRASAQQIFAMYKEGCTVEEIASLGGVQLAYVVCILKNKFNVEHAPLSG